MQHLLKPNLKIVSAPARIVNFSGKWKNQLKSVMELTTDKKGNVKGTYSTGVGTPTSIEKFNLTGFVSGDLIVFSVNFGKYGSMASWAGQLTLRGKKEVISTLWHLAINIKDEEEDKKLWEAIWTGADFFERQKN